MPMGLKKVACSSPTTRIEWMTVVEKKKPETLNDDTLDGIEGAGLMGTEAGTFGFEPITLERGVRARKSDTYDTEFET